MSKRIGVLTGGGDTSALNATLKGIALQAEEFGYELIGFMEGWAGVLTGGSYIRLSPDLIDENRGGTLLQSSRTNLRASNKIDEAVDNLKKLKIDALIPIGGDDTLSVGSALSEHFTTTFVTKTIDNDVGINCSAEEPIDYTKIVNYFCPGFPSAANLVAKYIRDIRTTTYSHNRVVFVEAMGRYAGWLTLAAAYGNADLILIPEITYGPDKMAEVIEKQYIDRGHLVVAVSEGISDAEGNLISESAELDSFGHARSGGCSEIIADHMKSRMPNLPSSVFRHQVLGYMQRCGSPIPIDRDTAIKAGKLAVFAIENGQVNHVSTIMRTSSGIAPHLVHLDQVLKRGEDGHVIRRDVDTRIYEAEDFRISPAGFGYFRAIIGDTPKIYATPELEIMTIK